MNINKILRWGVLVGLFVMPFLPLLISTSAFFPFITGKNFVFRVIAEIVFALWLILALRDKNYWPRKSYILFAVLALLAATGLATIFSENPYRSFWSNYERMGGLVSLLHLGAYFIVLISVLKKKAEWFWLANTALVANWLIVIYSLLQLAGKIEIHQGGVRLDATLGNATYLAVYLLFNIFISAYLFSSIKNIGIRVLYGLTILVDLFLLYHTATRGTILGLLVGLVIFAAAAVFRGSRVQKKWAAGVVVIILILAGGFLLVKDASFVRTSPVLSRFASISLTETTTQSRFLIWNMSWQGFKEHPVLGWGPENYSIVFSKYYVPAMWRQEPWFDRSHNVFFDWLIDAGLLGLLAYLSIFVSALYYLWQSKRASIFNLTEKAILTGLLAGYFFHNIFVFDNLISYLYFFAVIAFVHFGVTKENNEEEIKVKNNYQANKKNLSSAGQITTGVNVASVAVIVVLLVSLYYVDYKPWHVSRELIVAIHPQTSVEQSLAAFQRIFQQNTFGSSEAREQLVNKVLNVLNDPKVSNELKGQFVKLTEEQIKIQLTNFNRDARSYLYFGSFMSAIGNSEQGIDYLLKAQALSPKKQQIYFELIGVYVRMQNAPKALALAKEAYDLDPAYPEARKIYALVLLMTNQNKTAQEILAPIKDSATYYNDERFKSLYEQLGDTQSLQEIKNLQSAANKK
ncbi:MAG: O-antigen ligase family protein [Candidatus Paceibacterota bacterium]|jgi:O-antigen ligase